MRLALREPMKWKPYKLSGKKGQMSKQGYTGSIRGRAVCNVSLTVGGLWIPRVGQLYFSTCKTAEEAMQEAERIFVANAEEVFTILTPTNK